MSERNSNPPRVAVWLLRGNPALAGDLIESFREGKSRGWFWRQVLIAILVRVGVQTRQHWPQFCYAVVATALMIIPWGNPDLVAIGFTLWKKLPWPLSQLVMNSATLIARVDLGALPVLWLALVIQGTFRWISLLRTQILSVVLIMLDSFLSEIFPPLFHPVRGHPGWKELLVPQAFPVTMIFLSYLIAAWMGCLKPQPRPNAAAR